MTGKAVTRWTPTSGTTSSGNVRSAPGGPPVFYDAAGLVFVAAAAALPLLAGVLTGHVLLVALLLGIPLVATRIGLAAITRRDSRPLPVFLEAPAPLEDLEDFEDLEGCPPPIARPPALATVTAVEVLSEPKALTAARVETFVEGVATLGGHGKRATCVTGARRGR